MDQGPSSDVPVLVAPQMLANRNLIPQVVSHDVAMILCGISVVLCFRYFPSLAFRTASIRKKGFIISTTVCYSVSVVFMTARTGRAAVSQRRDLAFFDKIGVVEVVCDFACVSTVILTQIFLARRAYMFAGHVAESPFTRRPKGRLIPRLVLFGAIVSIACTCVGFFTCFALIAKKQLAIQPRGRLELRAFFVALVSSAVTDVIISMSLAWHWLLWLKHEQGLSTGAQSLLRRLVAFTLATALYTTVPAIAAAIIIFATSQLTVGPSNTAYFFFSHLLAPVYFIALMTTLTLRDGLRKDQSPKLQQLTLPIVGLTPIPKSQQEQDGAEARKLDVQLASGGFVIKSSEFVTV